MIIVYDKIGQMSNRIWSAVPAIAYSLENNEKMVFIYFGDYIHFFPHINENSLIRFYGIKGKWAILFKVLSKLSKLGIIPARFRDLNSKVSVKFIQGWRSRHMVSGDLITKHKAEICKIFGYSDDIIDHVNAVFEAKRKDNEVIVGVHIRRGDYQKWINGKYYFSDELYSKWIKAIDAELKEQGKTASFYIASNEHIKAANYMGIKYFTLANSSSEKDIYALSKCDYIMGPTSTYSQWAAFIGNIPIRFLLSREEVPTLKDFSKVVSLFYFESGQSMILDETGFRYVDGLKYNYNRI